MEMMAYRYMFKNERQMMMNNAKLKNDDLNGLGIGSNNSGPLLVLHLPDLRTLSVMSRSLFLVMFLFALPSISSKMSGSSSQINFKSNLRYLVEEGILKKGHQGLVVVSSSIDEGNLVVKDFDLLNQNGIDLTFSVESNVNIPNEGLDFVFVQNLKNVEAIDRMIKLGGVVISQLENNKRYQVQAPGNYAVVFLRPLENSMVVLRKIRHPSSMMTGGLDKKMPGRRSLCGITPQAKKAALLGLEDAMLEPPTKELAKRNKLSRKMKFLPDLLEDSLQNYPRRIFLSDGDKGVTEWFKKNYPSRGQEFEFFDMDVVANKAGNKKSTGVGLLSDWLRNHVKEEDYVVVKAEATLVEEMIKENTACLVDELFLECKSQWGDEEYDGEEVSGKRRPYWQCLSLYGKLWDEGVAVHQWWS